MGGELLGRRRTRFAIAAVAVAALLVPAMAFGHIERASYWPDPAPDQAGTKSAGGEVPTARSLKSAVKKKNKKKGKAQAAGTTRVVCKANSMKLLKQSIRDAKKNGFDIRPTDHEKLSKKEARKLKKINKKLFKKCKFDEIQEAITASGNNDRVVVMPGVYTEPTSRAQPTNDPRCDGLEEENDKGQTGANSYRYVATCPNDQSLVTIIGREPGPAPPQPPLDDRHGIPDVGPCIRCNLQLEGSGVSADDVVLDAGNVAAGNNGPPNPVKDVALKADRADGFVLRNMTFRHAAEHGIYVHEADGYVLKNFKTFHNEEYGVLTFTSDHGLITDCEAASSGDAGLYPGSAPDTGEQVNQPSGNDVQRLNTEIRNCDMHHNTAGFSGTAANAVWFHHNEVYDNALGFTTDVFTAAGHPGFPQDSDLIEHNNFYSNNFNPFLQQPPETEVTPTIPVPVGTGLWIAGGNNNTLRNNHFWDNWRRGIMLFSVPDVFVCGDNPIAGGNQQYGCDPNAISTSYRNRFHDNVMGVTPEGQRDPNGLDFWWDEAAGNTNNCWFGNTGAGGTRESVAADPAVGPTPGANVPGFLPEECSSSIGSGLGTDKVGELLSCFASFDQGADTPCTWFETPPEPTRRR
jgi:Right handed beta helix region